MPAIRPAPARPAAFIASPALATTLALILALVAAAPASAQSPDVDRLMADLSHLASDALAGRAAGSEGAEDAREHITARLREMGHTPVADTFTVRRREESLEGVNLRVEVEGSEFPDRYLVVTAHYDHLGTRNGEIYNGADDNASGVAGVLALAEWLASDRPRHTVILLFTDAEEGGLQGARHFVSAPPVPLDRVLLNVNLDMISRSDADLWVAGTYPRPSLRPLVEGVAPAAPVVLRFGHDTPEDEGADNWIMASDHGPFHEAGVPFLYFGVADHPDYHRPTDDAEAVDPAFFGAAVETIRRVVEAADGALEGRRPAG